MSARSVLEILSEVTENIGIDPQNPLLFLGGVILLLVMLYIPFFRRILDVIAESITFAFSVAFLLPGLAALWLETTQPQDCRGIINHGKNEPAWLVPAVGLCSILFLFKYSGSLGKLCMDSLFRGRYTATFTLFVLLYKQYAWWNADAVEFLGWFWNLYAMFSKGYTPKGSPPSYTPNSSEIGYLRDSAIFYGKAVWSALWKPRRGKKWKASHGACLQSFEEVLTLGKQVVILVLVVSAIGQLRHAIKKTVATEETLKKRKAKKDK